jgi:hypothetical protein
MNFNAPPPPNALVTNIPPFLNPAPAVARQTALIHGSAAISETISWVGMGGDKITISTTPLPPPSMKSTVPEHESITALANAARHTISVDPKMAVHAQANPSAKTAHVLG